MTLIELRRHFCKLGSVRFRRQGAVTVCRDCGEVYFVEGHNSEQERKEWVSVSARSSYFKAQQVAFMAKVQERWHEDGTTAD